MNFHAIKSKIAELPLKYGASAFITIQILGTITYFLILAYLIGSGVDLAGVVRYFGVKSVADLSNSFWGRSAVAFVLNRMLSPIRLLASFWIVPLVAPWMNPILNSWYERLTGKTIELNVKAD